MKQVSSIESPSIRKVLTFFIMSGLNGEAPPKPQLIVGIDFELTGEQVLHLSSCLFFIQMKRPIIKKDLSKKHIHHKVKKRAKV